MKNDTEIRRYETSSGKTVYKLPVEAFPKHFTNCYLVKEDAVTLIDCGSGWTDSNENLSRCFAELHSKFGETVTLSDVDRLILTHGHIDHFGGMNYVHEHSDAEVAIHGLDASVINNFDERLIVASKNLHVYLDRAGVSTERVDQLLTMHKWSKGQFHASKDLTVFEEGPIPDSPFHAYHTPGHCPGQVCLQLDGLLFTADHVLSFTTPAQAPEMIYRYTGLGHYFEALRKVRAIDDVRLGLGGHENEMNDVPKRTNEIIEFHERRLDKTLGICDRPKSIQEISLDLFGERKEYHVLLALLETGAHVEYLYERGQLVVSNIEEIEEEPNPVLKYVQA